MPDIQENDYHPLKPLKWYKSLSDGKHRRASGFFLVEGTRAIRQIADYHPESVSEIVAVEEMAHTFTGFPLRQVTEAQFKSISQSQTPQGILAVVRLPEHAYSDTVPDEPGDRILLLEDIQDPGNTGTLIRTAAAFGFSGIVLSGQCADPFAPKTVQSTAGTVLSVWIRRTTQYHELVDKLQQQGYTLVITDLSGNDDLSPLWTQDRLILGMGNEAAGISDTLRKQADTAVKIPIDRQKAESLNVAVCGAIGIFLTSWQR